MLPTRILKKRRERRRPRVAQDDPTGRSVPPILDPEAPEIAGASLLVNRYPAALDSIPTITDNSTPLSGIFHNYLALMLEACMAELGPFAEMSTSLKDYLGVQFANTVSNWRSFDKKDEFGRIIGNEAGQIFGLIKNRRSLAALGYTNEQAATTTTHQGVHPQGKDPILFAEVIRPIGSTEQDMVNGVAGGVRGAVTGVNGSQIAYNYRGSPATSSTSSSPQGAFTQPVNILIAFLVEAP